MIWPFTREKPKAAETDGPTPQEIAAEAVEALARDARRAAANQRVIDRLREAAEARSEAIDAEAEHVKTTDERRKKAETTIRKAQEKATEVSGVFDREKVRRLVAEAEAQANTSQTHPSAPA